MEDFRVGDKVVVGPKGVKPSNGPRLPAGTSLEVTRGTSGARGDTRVVVEAPSGSNKQFCQSDTVSVILNQV